MHHEEQQEINKNNHVKMTICSLNVVTIIERKEGRNEKEERCAGAGKYRSGKRFMFARYSLVGFEG